MISSIIHHKLIQGQNLVTYSISLWPKLKELQGIAGECCSRNLIAYHGITIEISGDLRMSQMRTTQGHSKISFYYSQIIS